MRTEIHVGVFDVFIFLGVFQGFLLSWFFIKSVQNTRKANLYQGLLLLSLSLCIFEEWLNNTGYITKVLSVSNFSESLSFTLGPLFYLYLRSSLNPDERRKDWVHFIFTFLWLFNMMFYFIQTNEYKYNSYVETKHPDWDYLRVRPWITDDPLGIRAWCSQLIAVQFLTYLAFAIRLLLKRSRSLN